MNCDSPTEKQYEYALKISEELEIDLPKIFTKSAYSDFINLYQNEYKRSTQRYKEEEEDDYE